MSLVTLTEKMDALRIKGFSDEDINQLLSVETLPIPVTLYNTSLNVDKVLEALKSGDTKILQQLSAGKDPATFNKNVDELVNFTVKSGIVQLCIGSLCLIIFGVGMYTRQPILFAISFIFLFFVIIFGNYYRYKKIKPMALYFIKK